SLVTNPYAVVVNASAITGVRPSFSNYGVATTDVFAPGSSILSTVPLKQGRYYPSSAPNAVAYDSFDTPGTSSVTAHSDPGFTVSDSNKIGTVDTASNFHFDTAGSLKLEGKDLYKEKPGEYTDYSVLLKIPFDQAKAANIRNIGLTASASGATFAMGAGIQTADGSFVSDPNNRIGLIYGWDMLTINLPELLKGKQAVYQVDENGKAFMVVKLMFKSHPQPGTSDNFTLYLDMVGMGNETAGYHFASGTSMATPMAVGVTAVHMQRIAQANAGLSPAERARLGAATVRGSVETVPEFEGLCTSGGQVSLDPGVVMTPVINSAKLAGSAKDATITVEGYFFGDAKSTVTIAGKTAPVVSWSDRSIVVQCPEGVTEGAREIMVNNTAGKTGRKTLNLPIPANPGDGSLPLFEETIALPDNMFGKESLGNRLIGLGGKVYTLLCNPDRMYGDLWSYDPATKQWQQHPSMPSNLDCVSTTLYDGKILVLGRCGDNQDEKKMFSFDPSTNTWAQIDGIDRVPLGAALVNAAGTLLLVGGESVSATTGATKAAPALLETDNIAVFDFATGSVTPVGTLKESRMTWQFANEGQDVAIVAHGSDVYVAGGMKYEGGSSDPVRLSPTSMERLTKTENGYVSQMLGSSLPPLAQAAGYPVDYGLTAIKAGPVISGFKAATDVGGKKLAEPDTYVLDVAHPEAGFANLGKRAAYGPLFYPQTTAYEGVLYTMGIDSFEETQMVLRGTAVETLPQAGDVVSPVAPEPQEPKAPKAPGSLVATGDTTGTLMAFAGLLAAVCAAVLVVCVIRARLQRKW
ncbi:MAG: kelch repeat-containing protein, partial [Clostridia bacterium]